jgi:hypothetical protein
MAEPAVTISGLSGVTTAAGFQVEAGALRVSPEGLRRLAPPGVPLTLDGLAEGRLRVRGSWNGLAFPAEVLVEGTSEGRLRFRLIAVRAGLLPLPVDLVAGVALGRLPEAPGVRRVGNAVEVDLAEILEPHGIALPPIRRVAVDGDGVEIRFGRGEAPG